MISPNAQNVGFDVGDINSIFIPPKTYSPKIASSTGGMLFAVLEKVSSVRDAMIDSLKNEDTRKAFDEAYGEGASEHVIGMGLEKEASSIDNSKPEAKFSISEVASSNWELKKEASDEFAKNGFVISHGVNSQTKSLEKIATVETRLKDITGSEAIESIDLQTPGVYTVYDIKDLKPSEIVVANDFTGKRTTVVSGKTRINSDGVNSGNPVVGKKIESSASSSLKDFSNFMSAPSKERVGLVFLNNGEVSSGITLYKEGVDIKKGLGSTIIEGLFSSPVHTINIEKGSSATPTLLGSTLYVGENNVKFVEIPKISPKDKITPVRMRDLDSAYNASGDIVKVAFDGVEYNYNHNMYSKHSLVNQLLKEGYDKYSIYELVKTAADGGSAEMVAINAKIDMLASMITNLAGQIQSSQQAVQQAAQGLSAIPAPMDGGQGIVEDAGMAQEGAPAEGQQALAQQGTMMPDPYSGMPSEEYMAAQEQAAQQQAMADQQLLQQQPQMAQQDPSMAMAQAQPQDGEAQVTQNGMNPAIDPAILSTLAQLKDSNIMDAGIVSVLINSDSISDVVDEYKGDVMKGASSVGRILLNAMVKKNQMELDIGEKKYKQMVKNLKNIFIKMSDLYADILKMELESDGKMEG